MNDSPEQRQAQASNPYDGSGDQKDARELIVGRQAISVRHQNTIDIRSVRDHDQMDLALWFLENKYRSVPNSHTIRWWKGRFWLWNGKKYMELDYGEIKAETIKWMHKLNLKPTTHKAKSIVEMITGETLLKSADVEPPCWIDGRRNNSGTLICLNNGLLDVNAYLAGQLKPLYPHTREYFTMNSLAYDFDPMAVSLTWLDFLDEILVQDYERISLLQELFGYCLLPDTRFNKAFVFVGEGANGKTVVLNVLKQLVGQDNCSFVPLEVFGQRFQLAQTLGKLVNFCGDVGELDRIAEGSIKMFTDGSNMTFERKGKDSFSAKSTARLVIATNSLPRISDKSDGIWRRLIVIPFNYQVPEKQQDSRFKEDNRPDWKFRDELPGILIWALEGLQRLWRNKKFSVPLSCRELLDRYRLDCNPARTFLKENYRESANELISVDGVYQKYKTFCGESGYQKLSVSNFGKEVFRTFQNVKKARSGTRGNRYHEYVGISEL